MLYLILIESTSIISSRVSIQFSHYYGIYYGKEEKFIIIFPFYVDYAWIILDRSSLLTSNENLH